MGLFFYRKAQGIKDLRNQISYLQQDNTHQKRNQNMKIQMTLNTIGSYMVRSKAHNLTTAISINNPVTTKGGRPGPPHTQLSAPPPRRSCEERDQHVLCVKELPDVHVTTGDVLLPRQVHLERPLPQEGAQHCVADDADQRLEGQGGRAHGQRGGHRHGAAGGGGPELGAQGGHDHRVAAGADIGQGQRPDAGPEWNRSSETHGQRLKASLGITLGIRDVLRRTMEGAKQIDEGNSICIFRLLGSQAA